MKQLSQQYGRSFLLSFMVHGILITLLAFNFHSNDAFLQSQNSKTSLPTLTHPSAKAEEKIVQAAIVDEKAVMAEIKRQETQEKLHKEEIHKAEAARREREKEQAKLSQLKKELAHAKQLEEARLAEIKIAKEKERKQLESLKQEKAKEEKRLAELDERRQEEQERANQLRQHRELEEKRQKQLDAKKQAGSENATRESSENTDGKSSNPHTSAKNQSSSERQSILASELARIQALFRDKVNQSWIRAPGLPTGLACMLEIFLLPDGTVTGVKVITSSGNYAFDQAAEAAVQKASPLPVPKEAELLEKFRHFTFEFKPPEAA